MKPKYQDKSYAEPIALPEGFFYVDQANCVVVNVQNEPEKTYLYSDSATSCIIVIVIGQNANDECLVSLSHELTRPNIE